MLHLNKFNDFQVLHAREVMQQGIVLKEGKADSIYLYFPIYISPFCRCYYIATTVDPNTCSALMGRGKEKRSEREPFM